MSGQPNNSPLDADKFRREYISQLQLRAELDDQNLQANKVFRRTGQKNELQDYRTASEKLTDIEGVKRRVRSELQKIMSPQIASEVISAVDNADLVFLAQNLENMVPNIKKLYAVGITEADQFLDYFRRYFEKIRRTGGVELGLQQSTGNQILLGIETILNEAVSVEQLREIAQLIQRTNYLSRSDANELRENINEIDAGIRLIREDVAQIMRSPRNYDPLVIADIQEAVNRITNQLPTNDQIASIIARIDTLARVQDVQGIKDQVETLQQILTQDNGFKLELDQLRMMVSELFVEVQKPKSVYIPYSRLSGAQQAKLDTYYEQLLEALGEKRLFTILFNTKPSTFLRLTVPEKKRLFERADDELALAFGRMGRGEMEIRMGKEGGGKVEGKGVCCDKCMVGGGLVRAYTPKPTDIDEETGVAPTPKYSKLGRYLIHKGKMNDDIISIRRPSGTFVGDFPSQRVSKNLGKVFRSIVGGGVPTFDELNSLNEEERLYLHKLAKSARIEDKLNIPAPKMEEDEKDIRRFEILKGQIMSGQDNREMIKEFKLLILKLSKKGHIPKGQVKDLLVDLASMGF